MASSNPTVVFDVGNVLLRWDARLIYRALIPDPERLDWFMQNVCTMAWNIEQDRGRSWEEAVASLVAEHPEWEREIKAYDERWHDSIPEAIAGSVAVLEELKARAAAQARSRDLRGAVRPLRPQRRRLHLRR